MVVKPSVGSLDIADLQRCSWAIQTRIHMHVVASLLECLGESHSASRTVEPRIDPSVALQVVAAFLTVVYWYTRRTSAGISHLAIWIKVVPIILDVVARHTLFPISMWRHHLGMAAWAAITELVPWLLELHVVSSWVLDGVRWNDTKLRHRLWTHRERASMRKDMSIVQATSVSAVP